MSIVSGRAVVLACIMLLATPARATFHLWQITQIYSNASGTVQYIEFDALAGFQQFLAQHTLSSSQGSSNNGYTFLTDLPGDTTNKSFLVGTQGFADLGIVAPDYVIPNGFLFLPNGSVNYANVDIVSYGSLPTDGVHAIDRNGIVVTNGFTNFAGASGSILPAPPVPPPPPPPPPPGTGVPGIPTLSELALIAMVLSLAALAVRRIHLRRALRGRDQSRR